MDKLTAIFSMLFREGSRRKLDTTNSKIVYVIGIAFSLYQLWFTLFSTMDPYIGKAIHLVFVLIITYLCYNIEPNGGDKVKIYDYGLAILALTIGVFFIWDASHILTRWPLSTPLSKLEFIFALCLFIMVIDVARRVLGVGLPMVVVATIIYYFSAKYIPGLFYFRGTTFAQYLDQMIYTVNGLFGTPMQVAATYVFLFVLFGTVLEESGGADFFFNIATGLAGASRGGPAKIAVLASGLFGTISGSPVANVVTTGNFTIPLMKRIGYKAHFAGAVEAVASTGGSIMPPIMGTAAFLMIEVAGVPYSEIIVSALIPAVLYYFSIFLSVDFEAARSGLQGMPKEELPDVGKTLKTGFQFMLPLVLIVVLLFRGYTLSRVAVFAIICTIAVSWLRKETRMTPKKILDALAKGGKAAATVSVGCAAAGLVIGGIVSTNLGGKFTSMVLSYGGENLLPILFLTALACIILGMGMPIPGAYLLTATLAVPAMLSLGIELMAAHMFAIYFAAASAITPPVAVAAFAASGIAQANPNKIGFTAMRLGVVAYLVPFFFVYAPELLMLGNPWSIAISTITAFIGTFFLIQGFSGWCHGNLNWLLRILLIVGGILLIDPGNLTNLLGIITAGAVNAFCLLRMRKNKQDGQTL